MLVLQTIIFLVLAAAITQEKQLTLDLLTPVRMLYKADSSKETRIRILKSFYQSTDSDKTMLSAAFQFIDNIGYDKSMHLNKPTILAERYKSIKEDFDYLEKHIIKRELINDFSATADINYNRRIDGQVTAATFTKYIDVFKDLKFYFAHYEFYYCSQ